MKKVQLEAHWNLPAAVEDLIRKCRRFDMDYVVSSKERLLDRLAWQSIKLALKGRDVFNLLDPERFRQSAIRNASDIAEDPDRYRNDVIALGQVVEYHIAADDLETLVKYLRD